MVSRYSSNSDPTAAFFVSGQSGQQGRQERLAEELNRFNIAMGNGPGGQAAGGQRKL